MFGSTHAIKYRLIGAVVISAALAAAQTITPPQPVVLWPGQAPGALGATSADSVYVWPYPATATNNTGAALIVCPGGGYDHLATEKEGYAPALWFQSHGISAFVLKYRLGTDGYHYPVEIEDGQRAVRWVRQNAQRYAVDPKRVGMLGFSAGGHLASAVGTHYDAGNPAAADSVERQSDRPDFLLLVYPVITMETPPAFLASGLNDSLYHNSVMFDDSCLVHHVPAELHLYADGPHGFGLADGQYGAPDIPATALWTDSALTWLNAQHFLTPTSVRLHVADHKLAGPEENGAVLPLFRRAGQAFRNLLGRLIVIP